MQHLSDSVFRVLTVLAVATIQQVAAPPCMRINEMDRFSSGGEVLQQRNEDGVLEAIQGTASLHRVVILGQ